MKYYEEEFTIDNFGDYHFRFIKLDPITLLDISNDLILSQSGSKSPNESLEDFEKRKKLAYRRYLTSAVESCEVKIKESWQKVKVNDIYCPATLETNIIALTELTNKFFELVIKPVFIASDK